MAELVNLNQGGKNIYTRVTKNTMTKLNLTYLTHEWVPGARWASVIWWSNDWRRFVDDGAGVLKFLHPMRDGSILTPFKQKWFKVYDDMSWMDVSSLSHAEPHYTWDPSKTVSPRLIDRQLTGNGLSGLETSGNNVDSKTLPAPVSSMDVFDGGRPFCIIRSESDLAAASWICLSTGRKRCRVMRTPRGSQVNVILQRQCGLVTEENFGNDTRVVYHFWLPIELMIERRSVEKQLQISFLDFHTSGLVGYKIWNRSKNQIFMVESLRQVQLREHMK